MKALVLRTCKPDMTSYNGFVWPKEGPVECPDWDPKPQCGNGLHGALWGEGDGALFNSNDDAVWQVVEIDEWVKLGGKVKFPRGNVVHTGTRLSATSFIRENGAKGTVIGDFVTVGNREIASTGDLGTAIAGVFGTAVSCYNGTAKTGDFGIATVGDRGSAISGDYGIATAGKRAIATVGDCGSATAGDYGIATAGNHGTATAGNHGTAAAGANGIIQIKYFDKNRIRMKVGYIGEDGLEPNVKYKLNDNFEFEKA
jgi:hypothetical protein